MKKNQLCLGLFLLQGILARQLGFSSVLFILIPYSLKFKGILVNLLFPEHCEKQTTDITAFPTKPSIQMAFSIRGLNFLELTHVSNKIKRLGHCFLICRGSFWTCICICKNANNLFTHSFSVRQKLYVCKTSFHVIA